MQVSLLLGKVRLPGWFRFGFPLFQSRSMIIFPSNDYFLVKYVARVAKLRDFHIFASILVSMKTKSGFKRTYHNFYEIQRYRNFFVLLLLVVVEGYLLYMIFEDVMGDKLWGSKKYESWRLIAITALLPTPLLISFFIVRLETIVTEEGIFYRWFPFKRNYNMVLWEVVKEVFIVDTKQVGLRWRFTNKYNETNFPGSDFALLIQMKNGKTKLLGTRKAEELNRVLIRNSANKYHSTFVEKYDKD